MKQERHNELAEKDWRFRALFENALDAIFIASAEGIFTDVNKSCERMLGYETGGLTGKLITDILLPEEASRFLLFLSSMPEGEPKSSEWTLVGKDGSPLAVEISSNLLPDKTFQAFVRDITERQRADEELLLMKYTIDQVPDSAAQIAADARFVFVNDACCSLSVTRAQNYCN